jgi:hypothetical protein
MVRSPSSSLPPAAASTRDQGTVAAYGRSAQVAPSFESRTSEAWFAGGAIETVTAGLFVAAEPALMLTLPSPAVGAGTDGAAGAVGAAATADGTTSASAMTATKRRGNGDGKAGAPWGRVTDAPRIVHDPGPAAAA